MFKIFPENSLDKALRIYSNNTPTLDWINNSNHVNIYKYIQRFFMFKKANIYFSKENNETMSFVIEYPEIFNIYANDKQIVGLGFFSIKMKKLVY
jgi:hypothetical protein